ncbi:MAG: hypothetical protein LUE93_08215 [Bacteroides sp.]|nr:hypothetical protein [Bacteroides sp.]
MKIDHLLEVLKGDKAHLIYSGLAFLAGVLLVGLLYQYIVKKLTDRAKRLHARIDYFVVQVLRVPPPLPALMDCRPPVQREYLL